VIDVEQREVTLLNLWLIVNWALLSHQMSFVQ